MRKLSQNNQGDEGDPSISQNQFNILLRTDDRKHEPEVIDSHLKYLNGGIFGDQFLRPLSHGLST